MTMHVLAFDSSINSASLVQIASVADQQVPKSSNGYQVPPLNKVGCLWAQGATLVSVEPQSPALRPQPYPLFQPINIGVKTLSPVRAAYMWHSPLVLNPLDEFDMFANNAAGGAEHDRAFAIMFDTPPAPVSGPFLRVPWTSTTAVTAMAWSPIVIAFSQSLIAGNYAIVGGTAFSATGLAWRVIPTQGSPMRPGGNMGVVNSDMFLEGQVDGRWGIWTIFNSLTPPQLELYCIANDASYYGELILLPQ